MSKTQQKAKVIKAEQVRIVVGSGGVGEGLGGEWQMMEELLDRGEHLEQNLPRCPPLEGFDRGVTCSNLP